MNKVFTVLWLLFSLNTLSQTTYFVNDNASGIGNGSSWTDAFTQLQDALAAAVSGDQVWVAAGIYYPDEGGGLTNDSRAHSFFLKTGVAIYGGFAGTETQLSERNVTANVTVLSGEIQQDNNDTNNANHVVQSIGVDKTAVLDGFTITKGGNTNNNDDFPAYTGGGMYNSNSSPSLINCRFLGNTAVSGGGISNNNFSSPIIINCIFWGNTVANGGGIINSFSSPSLINCSFSANTAGGGGGIYNADFSSPTLTNCIFWGNINGQIFNTESSEATVVTYSIVQGGFPGTGNLDQDPLFVDAANGDLHLKVGSPAIDVGLNSANTTSVDLDGNPRVVNQTIDMGAYEFQDAGTVVSSFTLVNADTDQDIRELKDGAIIDLAALPSTNLNIRANTNPPVVGSVVFDLTFGSLRVHRADNTAPYAFIRYDRDNTPRDINDYHGVIPPLGAYTLTATPYSGAEGSGQKGTAYAITFKVVNTLPTTYITERTEVSQLMEEMPKHFRVTVAPNPFNTTTKLQFELPNDGTVSIKVYDVVGREIATVIQAERKAGMYSTDFSAASLAKGIYYYRALLTSKLKVNTQTGKMLVIK